MPEFDTSSGTKFDSMFSNCIKLETVPRFDVSSQSSDFARFEMDQPFYNCSALKNLTVIGVIKASGLNLRWSTELSKESITSVINALDSSTSGNITLSHTAVHSAFGYDESEWTTLIRTKSNWTISLS